MFSYSPIKKRKKIYTEISKLNLKSKENLFFYNKIKFHKEILFLTNLYLKENIRIFFKKKFVNLDKSINSILELPNISPGGILYPKKETQLIYNLIVYF